MEGFALQRIQCVAFIVHHEIEHRAFWKARWLIYQEPSILDARANR
ncbi:MAG: hypothetical protein IPG81_12905 [Sandaracinaceae bacterium]|nr:hypothetical protein [Sandaracinaceae bacterium]